MICHITTHEAWQQALNRGTYQPKSLDVEGFIHFSKVEQVVDVANAFYRGQEGLALLVVDPAFLTAGLRYEAPAPPGIAAEEPSGDLFPHLYGPLNVDAVTDVMDFPPGPDGFFQLPEDLAG